MAKKTRSVQSWDAKDGVYYSAGKRWMGFKRGDKIEWREVLYKWAGRKSQWVMTFDSETEQKLTEDKPSLINARYFEGAGYRGDMAYYGDGFGSLSDGVAEKFKGSIYTLLSNFADAVDNYVPWIASNAEAPPLFEIDGVEKLARFSAEKDLYYKSVSKDGFEGYNWGFGAFSSTTLNKDSDGCLSDDVPQTIYPNSVHLTFKPTAGFDYSDEKVHWLLSSTSETELSYNEYFGETIVEKQMTYKSGFGLGFYQKGGKFYVGFARQVFEGLTVGKSFAEVEMKAPIKNGWYSVTIKTTGQGVGEILANEGYPSQTVADLPACIMKGQEFDHVFMGAGWDMTGDEFKSGLTFTPNDTFTARSSFDAKRLYIETAYGFGLEVMDYWLIPSTACRFISMSDGTTYDVTKYLTKLDEKPTNDECLIQMPPLDDDCYTVHFDTHKGETMRILPVRIKNDLACKEVLFDDFTDIKKTKQNFLLAHKQWGGTGQVGSKVELLNGGVVAENVKMFHDYKDDECEGVIQIAGHGTFYDGDVFGVDRKGENTKRKTEVGACIASRDYLGAGSYRMRIRTKNTGGACNAFWTFHYEEIYQNDERFEEFLAEGLHKQGTEEDGFYIVRNHEIDIEFPTALEDAENMEEVSFSQARLNSWIGELRAWDLAEDDPDYFSEYDDDFLNWSPTPLNDGEWHEIGFDWYIEDEEKGTCIEYYCDGFLANTIRNNVPTIAGRFWLGTWYPRAPKNRWAGAVANCKVENLDLDWFKFTPFLDNNTQEIGETFPNDIWHSWKASNFTTATTLNVDEHVDPIPDNLLKIGTDSDNATGAGAEPPMLIAPHRFEFRQDLPNTSGGSGDALINIDEAINSRVVVTITTIYSYGKDVKMQVLPYAKTGEEFEGVDRFDLYREPLSKIKLVYKMNNKGHLVLNNKVKYQGLFDVHIRLATDADADGNDKGVSLYKPAWLLFRIAILALMISFIKGCVYVHIGDDNSTHYLDEEVKTDSHDAQDLENKVINHVGKTETKTQ